MFKTLKKAIFAFVLLLMVASTGAWQSSSTALAAGGVPETPLAPGLTWKDLGPSVRNIQLNIKGDALELSGETFRATEKFTGNVSPAISNFYSNVALYKFGWSSDNAFEAADGTHRIFYHGSGYYLAVEYLKCADDANSICITVWKSAQKDTAKFIAGKQAPAAQIGASAVFGKLTPANSAVGLNPAGIYLSWSTYTPPPLGNPVLKYSYCVKAWSACADNDPNWTGTYLNTSISISDLNLHTVYYWQVKAFTNMDSLPKEYVLADNAIPWTFTTANTTVIISGYVGVGGAYLKFVDTTPKVVASNSNGYYAFSVPLHWSGTVTPSKLGVTFAPVNRTYTNVLTSLTGQNFTPTILRYTISGSVGIGGTTLSYVDVTTKTAITDVNGNYSISVPYNWSGKITPSRVQVVAFVPASRSYVNVKANFANQNFQANRVSTFKSMAAYDGWILESFANSGVGGILNPNANIFALGDDAQNRQYRSILSFDTSTLPDNAVILSAKLKITKQYTVGTDPMPTFGSLMMDITSVNFGFSPALELADFADPGGMDFAGIVGTTPVGNVYTGPLLQAPAQYVNALGFTQIRLRYLLATNNDGHADFIAFYSGNTPIAANWPSLDVVYYVPIP